MKISVIVTIPPYATFIDEVAAHPMVSGLRLNTVMPLRETHREVLERLSIFKQPLWVDLKGRQLRVAEPALPPFTEIKLSHSVKVQTPVDAFFSDGNERVRVAAVDGKRLIMEDGPRRMVGPGESVNIIHPSLEIDGTLTETDHAYLAAMKELGLTKVMLSYVESAEDVNEVRDLLPNAEVVSKIETQKGLAYARHEKTGYGQLMAARGDLYVEVLQPHKIIPALKSILQADPNAIVASRILDSLAWTPVPVSADISDVAFLMEIGYRTFMLGDQVCMKRDSVIEALNVLEAMG
ncbi:MAG TPA: pyruvate kinase [Anaerolineales bacterium]|nr:pyruvate kinase [Anaerolineales bacterium]HNN14665.1 pyruvate kinase [Anaerolineales bacterium]